MRVAAAIGGRARAALSRAVRRAQAWGRERVFPFRVRHVAGPRRVRVGPEDLAVVCLVRDGGAYLDEFLAHYRALGAAHVVFLDNGSEDGTVERAAREPGVTVLATGVPYDRIKVIAKRYLVGRFGGAGWVLCADIDELFEYPRRSSVPLPRFLRYLDARGFSAVRAHLLDLFPAGPLGSDGASWRTEHRFYDLAEVERAPYPPVRSARNDLAEAEPFVLHGGARAAFGIRPLLTKHPLLRPSAGARWEHSHYVTGARVADVSAVLLHYKFVSGFARYAERIAREGRFYDGSAEYRAYLDALERDPALSLHASGARELRRADQLLDEGFLAVSERYEAWAAGAGR